MVSSGALLGGCPDAQPGPPGPPDASDASDDSPSCGIPFLGDRTKEPEIELIALGTDGVSAKVADGASVAMILPPQGGRVIFAGVRATNVNPCGVKLSGTLRDLKTMKLAVNTRTINLRPTGDGWGASDDEDISSFANVAVCPNSWSETDVYGNEYELKVKLTDRDNHTVSKEAKVIPACAEPDNMAECLCICKAGYVLGEPCGGSSSGGGGGGGSGSGGGAPDGGV
jgi:hypothetical protein